MSSSQIRVESTESLRELSLGMMAFGERAGELLHSVGVAIEGARAWMEDRTAYWESAVRMAEDDVEEAAAALRGCESSGSDDESPDCSWEEGRFHEARARLQEAERALAVARRWADRVAEDAAAYESVADHLAAHLRDQLPLGIRFLEERIGALAANASLAIPGALATAGGEVRTTQAALVPEGPVEAPAPTAAAAAQTREQVKAIAAQLRDMHGLDSTSWAARANLQARLATLQAVERVVAQIQERPRVPIILGHLGPGVCGEFDGYVIRIDETHMREQAFEAVLDTVVHEGRHAFQLYAVLTEGIYPDAQEVERWARNFYGTVDYGGEGGTVDWDQYTSQATELDARSYATAVMDALKTPERADAES